MAQFTYKKGEAKRALIAIRRKGVKLFNSDYLTMQDFVVLEKLVQKAEKKMR